MDSTMALTMTDCEGGCGVLVRPAAKFCDACTRLNYLLETRRLADKQRQQTYNRRIYGVGEYAAHDVGIDTDYRYGWTGRVDRWLGRAVDRIDWFKLSNRAGTVGGCVLIAGVAWAMWILTAAALDRTLLP